MEKLIISEEKLNGKVPVALITLKGSIETTNAATLEEAIERVINDRCYQIVVDLGGVNYISSAGWGIFISEIKRVRRNGGDIKLAKMNPAVREVFEILEFHNILKPYSSKEDALRDFMSGVEKGPETKRK
ncbi:MAG: anti-sigma factor antagonist [Candidatus Latescibacteria bacterium]|nr:anti-sigma factor antagonist [Candidatus Latescibacterota bacterium]NIM21636.1 anti-sigma factor antagonist [Candidatus Latescibacterota bacterium]NIM64615.1 anti-sigma factor antagonist [Candidatus Latescibacterota bacterium]NIO01130.1 anti-sigma factor antagonist [Candidatus Latescibacterota bacterium]NIO27523.1 anti-sigma factor antagonist [Candidatus Latescibacterota bacterium]